MTTAAIVATHIRQELNEDYVGLWALPWRIRRAWPSATNDQVQSCAESVLEALLATGATLGTLDEASGTFSPWPQSTGLRDVMRAWRALGRDPNIGEIAWLADLG